MDGQMGSTSIGMAELGQLFQACDRQRKGFIGREEFGELCTSFQIESADADVIFADLDRDGDERISLEDFTKGFCDFLGQPVQQQQQQRPSVTREKSRLKRQSSSHAWRHLSERMGHDKIRQWLANSADQLLSLYDELPPQLVDQFENLLESLAADARQLELEKERVERSVQREREQHQQHLKSLEEELDLQVQRVAQVVRHESQVKFEAEKRNLQLNMEAEIAQLQTHLRLFQRVENWLEKEQQTGELSVRDQQQEVVEKTNNENRHLKLSLAEAQATLALLQTELSQLKSQYQYKDRQLLSEKEAMMDLANHQEHVQRQLDLLREANRHLQDTNDSLRNQSDFLSPRPSPVGFTSTDISRSASTVNCLTLPGFLHHQQQQQMPIADGMEDVMMITTEGSNSGHSSLMMNEFNDFNHQEMNNFSRQCSFRSVGRATSSLHSELQFASFSSPAPRIKFGSMRHNHQHHQSMEDETLVNELKPTGPADRTFKVVFAGDAAVGKSSFITRLHDGYFVSHTITTLGVDFKVKTIRLGERNVAIQLWDTAGQERFRSITQSYFRKADGVMLLFDVTNERSFLNVRHWSDCLAEACSPVSAGQSIPLVLCGTKGDLRLASIQQGLSCVDPVQAQRLAAQLQAQYVETSSKTGANLLEALVILTRQMMITLDEEVQTSALRLDRKKPITCCSRT